LKQQLVNKRGDDMTTKAVKTATTRDRSWARFSRIHFILTALAFAVVGGYLLNHSFAATRLLTTTYGPVNLTKPTNSVTPEQYGALGNGTHDDTSAIQSAINAAAGRIVWLSANKTYLCNASVKAPSNTTVEGAGPTAVLKFSWSDTSGSASKGGYYIGNTHQGLNSDTNITLTNFVVKGAGSGLPSGPSELYPNGLVPGVAIRGVTTFNLTHMEVTNVPGISVLYQGDNHGDIEYNNVHNSGRDGITGFWSGVGNLYTITVANNYINKVGDDGIAIWGTLPTGQAVNNTAIPYDIHITSNTVLGWTSNPNGKVMGRGIVLSVVNGASVQNNSVTNTYGNGILVWGCTPARCPSGVVNPATGQPWRTTDVQVLSNSVTNAGQLHNGSTIDSYIGNQPHDGMYFDTTDNSTASGNTITNSLQIPVYIGDCNNCNIQSS
jgi:hypothetical protein